MRTNSTVCGQAMSEMVVWSWGQNTLLGEGTSAGQETKHAQSSNHLKTWPC